MKKRLIMIIMRKDGECNYLKSVVHELSLYTIMYFDIAYFSSTPEIFQFSKWILVIWL